MDNSFITAAMRSMNGSSGGGWSQPAGTSSNADRHAAALDRAQQYSKAMTEGVTDTANQYTNQMASVGSSMMQMEADNEVNAINRKAAEDAEKASKKGSVWGTIGKVASLATMFI